ncbi:MAG: transcriptional regulator [Anaerolineales bacterium]
MSNKNDQNLHLDVEINRLVHEPARLKILAYLSAVEKADFVFLVSRIGLTMGNLSAHISKLDEVGYIKVKKQFKDNRPHTMITITEKGSDAFTRYREDILRIIGE